MMLRRALATVWRRPFSTSETLKDMWPVGYQLPIEHKKDIPRLKQTGEFDIKVLNPIRSAPDTATCSLFQNAKVDKFHRMIRMYADREAAEWQISETYRLIKKAQLAKYWKATPERRKLIVVHPGELILQAIENARPLMLLEKVQVGGAIYTVPVPVTLQRSEFEGMRWIINAARDRDKKKSRFYTKLSEVVVDTAAYQGRVIQIKDDHHKTCEMNRMYAHYRRTK